MSDASETLTDRFGYCDVTRAGAVATIVINRPEKLNAMTRGFWKDLRDILDVIQNDGRTRVAVITGGGDRAFSAGGDIAGFEEMSGLEELRAFQQDAMDSFAAVEFAAITVIAAVNGIAFGGGCELTLACDMAIASDDAQFAMPESRIGLVPGYGVVRAPDVIGRHMTKYLIASCDTISARRAYEIGMVQAVHPKAVLMDEVHALAERIATRSTLAIAVGKRLVNRGVDRAGNDYAIEAISMLQTSADRNEGVKAFLAKRPPMFRPPSKLR